MENSETKGNEFQESLAETNKYHHSDKSSYADIFFLQTDCSTTDYAYYKLHPFIELIKLWNHSLL